jgi:hypothetical protein
LVAIVGDTLNHGHDLGLCGPPPFFFLVATTNDFLGCNPFGRGCNLDCCLPSPFSCLQLLAIILIMVMIMIFIFLLLILTTIAGNNLGCGHDIDICLPLPLSCLKLLVILPNLKL